MSFLAPSVLRRARGDRRADHRPPDPARAEGHHRVPVADVHPARSRISRSSAAASTTGRCCCCAPPRWRCWSRRSRGRSSRVDPVQRRGGDDRRARGRHPARSIGQHGLRRPLDARAGRGAARSSRSLGGEDRATLVLFGTGAEEAVRADVRPRHGSRRRSATPRCRRTRTRYAPALRLAQSLLSRSALPRKEAYLISDFQKTGWERQEEIQLPEGATLTPDLGRRRRDLEPGGDVGRDSSARRSPSEERVTITAGLTNRSATAGDEAAGEARDRRPARRHARRHDRAERLRLGRRSSRSPWPTPTCAAIDPRRHRRAAARQRLPLRALAEPAGVGAGDPGRRRGAELEPLPDDRARRSARRRRSRSTCVPPSRVHARELRAPIGRRPERRDAAARRRPTSC